MVYRCDCKHLQLSVHTMFEYLGIYDLYCCIPSCSIMFLQTFLRDRKIALLTECLHSFGFTLIALKTLSAGLSQSISLDPSILSLTTSVQAIRKHKFINILDNPGSADLSAYVDFASIRHSAEEVSGMVIHHFGFTSFLLELECS